MLQIHIRRWTQLGNADIGRYMTTVTIVHPSVTTAVTLPGKFGRKEAIDRTYHHLYREADRWSPSFLLAVKNAK